MERSRKETAVQYSKFLLRFARKGLRCVDPRVVRFKKPRRFPKWVMATQVASLLLAIGVAATAAVLPSEETRSISEEGPVEKEQTLAPNQAGIQAEEIKPSKTDDSRSPREKPDPKSSKFYDPLYVFFDSEVESVTAYPLASPPGLVVDLKGTPEPTIEPDRFVGKDDRIRFIKRRVTPSGIRYIIGLTTPIKRIKTFKEGNVVMVFPRS